MELYLIRHGIAQERTSDIEDEKRSLTKVGHQKTEQVAKRLRELGLRFDVILTSPLVRSRQTAEILQAAGLSYQLEESSYLAPGGDIYAWLKFVEQLQPQPERIAIVGHQPDLGQWAEILVWGEARSKLMLKKAGIIGLTMPQNSPVGHGNLFWLTPPKFLV